MEEEEESKIFHEFLSKIEYDNYSDISWCFRNQQNQKFLEWLTENISSSNFLTKEEIHQYNELLKDNECISMENNQDSEEEDDELLEFEIKELSREYEELKRKNQQQHEKINQISDNYKKTKAKNQALDMYNIKTNLKTEIQSKNKEFNDSLKKLENLLQDFFSLFDEKSVLLSTQDLNQYYEKEMNLFESTSITVKNNTSFESYDDLFAIPMLEKEILELLVKIEKSNIILHFYNKHEFSNESDSMLKLKIQQLDIKIESSKETLMKLTKKIPSYYKSFENSFKNELLNVEYENKLKNQQIQYSNQQLILSSLQNQKNRLNLMKKSLELEKTRVLNSLELVENIYSNRRKIIEEYQRRMEEMRTISNKETSLNEEIFSNLISREDDKSLKQKSLELRKEIESIETQRNQKESQLDHLMNQYQELYHLVYNENDEVCVFSKNVEEKKKEIAQLGDELLLKIQENIKSRDDFSDVNLIKESIDLKMERLSIDELTGKLHEAERSE
eukprot:gene2774-4182_t